MNDYTDSIKNLTQYTSISGKGSEQVEILPVMDITNDNNAITQVGKDSTNIVQPEDASYMSIKKVLVKKYRLKK